MSYKFSDLNEIECRDERHKIEQFQREFSLMISEFKCRVENELVPDSASDFCQELDYAESNFITAIQDEIIGALKWRILEIEEENSREDWAAEVRHMTAAYPSARGSL